MKFFNVMSKKLLKINKIATEIGIFMTFFRKQAGKTLYKGENGF